MTYTVFLKMVTIIAWRLEAQHAGHVVYLKITGESVFQATLGERKSKLSEHVADSLLECKRYLQSSSEPVQSQTNSVFEGQLTGLVCSGPLISRNRLTPNWSWTYQSNLIYQSFLCPVMA